METISITSEEPFSMQRIEKVLSAHWQVEMSHCDTLVVHGDNGRVYIHPDTELTENQMCCLLVDYFDIKLTKKLVEAIVDDHACIVDCDFNTVISGDEFVARCKSDMAWDWRADFLRNNPIPSENDAKPHADEEPKK